MADSSSTDSRPLMMQHNNPDSRESIVLPEVVTADSFKEHNNRRNEGWSSYAPQVVVPGSHSNSVSPPFSNIMSQYPPEVSDDRFEKIPMKGFRKTSRPKFAILVALAVFLFTALALSTGLGIPLAKCRNRFNPDNYSPLAPLKVNRLKFNDFCTTNGELASDPIYEPFTNTSFDLFCGLNFVAGLPAFDPKTGLANGTIRDIVAIIAYDVDDCIKACASMNKLSIEQDFDNPRCQSVTFVADMNNQVSASGGNCFLKNATVANFKQASRDNSTWVSAEVHRLRAD